MWGEYEIFWSVLNQKSWYQSIEGKAELKEILSKRSRLCEQDSELPVTMIDNYHPCSSPLSVPPILQYKAKLAAVYR